MVTKSGNQCSRSSESGSFGFCWQNTPSKHANTYAWKKRLEGAALAVATSEVLLKVVELAITHLAEYFGSGDREQKTAKIALEAKIELGPYWPPSADNYLPGARVDRVALNVIVVKMDHVLGNAGQGLCRVEGDFKSWLDNMNEFHNGLLFAALDQANSNQPNQNI